MPEDQRNPQSRDRQVEIMCGIVEKLYAADFNNEQMHLISRFVETVCDESCHSWLNISALTSEKTDGYEFALLTSNMLEVPALVEGIQTLIEQHLYGKREGIE